MTFLAPFFSNFVLNLPLLIVLFVGLLISYQALIDPVAKRYLLIGIGIGLVGLLLSTVWSGVLPHLLFSLDASTTTMTLIASSGGFVLSLLQATAWGFVIRGATYRSKGEKAASVSI